MPSYIRSLLITNGIACMITLLLFRNFIFLQAPKHSLQLQLLANNKPMSKLIEYSENKITYFEKEAGLGVFQFSPQ